MSISFPSLPTFSDYQIDSYASDLLGNCRALPEEYTLADLENELEQANDVLGYIEERIENWDITDIVDEERFNEMLDDCQDSIIIAGVEFYPSQILQECDPTAYQVAYSDYVSEYDNEDFDEWNDMICDKGEIEDYISALEKAIEEAKGEKDDEE